MGSIKKTLLILIALTVLCGSAMAVDVEITSDPARTTVDEIANIYVRVLDNSTPQNNTLVNFTTNLGNLSAASAYTNSSGIATVWINSTTAGNATINASVYSVFNTTNVTYIAGKPVSIDINVTQNQLVVGNTTIVNLIPYDKYNNVNSTVNLTFYITISDILGEILHQVNITRAPYTLTHLVANQSTVTLVNSTNNISSVLLSINSTVAGNISLTASAENITSTVNITFTPAAIHKVSALYSNECTVNETSEIIVSVLDIYDNPIKGAVVMLNATPPPDTIYNSPVEYNSLNLTPTINITNQEGLTSTLFRADKRSGDNTINISVGSLNLTITIRGNAGHPINILLTHTPAAVYANNIDTYSLKAQVVDQFFNPVLPESGPLTKQILFTTSLGSTLVPLNESGCATTLVGPTPYIVNVTVTATYKNETGLTNITNNTDLSFVLGGLNRFISYANPDSVLISNMTGNHNSTITFIAMDEWGHPIPGINVMVNNTNTTLGNLTVEGINATNLINASTDSNGNIQALFTSNNITGNATITAMNGSINASITVEVKDQPFLSVFITTEPPSINSGDTVNVTTIISVWGELPITRPAARAMLVLDRSGSMDPDYYAGTPLDVVLVDDVSGSMDPDYYNSFSTSYWGKESYVENGFTPYDYLTNGSVSAGSWWIDYLVLNESVNDLKIVVSNNSLKLQLIDPGGKVYGYNGGVNNSPLYMWSDDMPSSYWDTPFNEWVWHKPYSYPNSGSYSLSADTDFPEQGTWTIRVYNPTASSSSFSMSSYIEKLSAVKIASRNFNENLNSNDRIGLVSFGGNGIDVYTLTHDVDSINTVVDGLYAYGGTPTGDAIKNAKDQLIDQQRPGARPYIILLSDGRPTVGTSNPVNYALAEAEAAKNTIINGHKIKIYTIGIGVDVDADFMEKAASSPSDYYHAASTSQLKEIYYSIAMQISDFDITTTEYGINGFTPYLQGFSGVGNHSININETINDLKIEIDNPDMNLTLISPSGVIYPDPVKQGYNNRTGVYLSETGKYIWISPISGEYPQTDMDNIEQGNWTINVTGSGSVNITSYIDKKSAAKLGSSAFISSFDESRGDRVGLALYSFDSVGNSNNQTSYLRGGSTWVGYFTVNTNGIYDFNLSWNDTSNLDIILYDGTTILNSSTGGSNPEVISSQLLASTNYHIVVSKDLVIGNDTQFTINVSSSPLRNAMSVYYDSNSPGVPRYRQWNGLQWSNEASANSVGGYIRWRYIRWIVMQSSPKRDEMILGTLDTSKDLNIQIWDGSTWGTSQELSSNEYSYSTRGFDIAYEENSGDAMIVYNRNQHVPEYQIWNGSAWKSGSVNSTDSGSSYIRWVRLAAKPDSNEMLLTYLDSANDIRAQIWNGSAWSNVIVLTTNARTYDYQSFDVVYEQGTGNAMVVWGQSDNKVRYSIWDGTSWSASNTIYTNPYGPYWIKLASDPNSDNILMGVLNSGKDVHVNAWNGSAWSPELKIEEDTYNYDKRIMDVAFDQSSGIGLVVWGDSTSTPEYRTWNGSWSPEYSALNLGGSGYTRWVQLRPDPFSNKMFLMTSDSNNNINIQQWNGTVWTARSNVETDSYSYKECFDLAYQRHSISIEQTPVSWTEWHATVTSTLNDSIAHLNNSIDTMTADGLTAIDEGIYEANNELSTVSGNSTIVLMTDGLDNAGYHSLMLEAQRARDNNTVIYTIGFGNNESEVDPVLMEIANITGGEYYFAPNASVLKSIFRGIAANITNFTAEAPTLNLHIPHNYITDLSLATATYVANSSNATTGNTTNFTAPTYPNRSNAEPNMTTVGNETILSWVLPNLNPGEKWGIWYQLTVQGAGYVPLILPSSYIGFTDVNGTNITKEIIYGGGSNLGGSGVNVSYLALGSMQLSANPSIVLVGETSSIVVTAEYVDGNPAIANVSLYTNLGYFNNSFQNIFNMTVSGSNAINFASAKAGYATINAVGNNGNNSVWENVVVVIRPKGMITIS